MIHTIKNSKWVITTSLICILFGLLTFFTFIDKSFIDLNKKNFQLLLVFDLLLLFLFFILIIKETYNTLKAKRKGLGILDLSLFPSPAASIIRNIPIF